MRCMNCREVVDSATGWIKNPDGVVGCWPCYEAGKLPPTPVNVYDEEPEPAPKPKRETKPRKPRHAISEAWD